MLIGIGYSRDPRRLRSRCARFAFAYRVPLRFPILFIVFASQLMHHTEKASRTHGKHWLPNVPAIFGLVIGLLVAAKVAEIPGIAQKKCGLLFRSIAKASGTLKKSWFPELCSAFSAYSNFCPPEKLTEPLEYQRFRSEASDSLPPIP